MKKNNFIYARYDKEDNCLGVYDTMEEAILKVGRLTKMRNKLFNSVFIII